VKSTEHKYALILNTVTTPLYFSSSKLYTKNFFDDVKARLNEGGVYVTWMDSRIGDAGADIILRSLNKSFKHCALSYVKGSYFLLIASDEPLVMHQQQAVAEQAELRQNLMQKHGVMSAWLAYHLMTTDLFSLIGDADGEINTADYPALEFEMARLQNNGIPKFRKRLLNHLNLDEVKQAMPVINEDFPAPFVLQAKERLRRSSIERWWSTLLASDDLEGKTALADLEERKTRMEVSDRIQDMHAYAYQLIKLERYAEALEILKKVVARDATYDNAYYNMGVCFEALGQDQDALKAFEKEMSLDPNDEDVAYRMARLWIQAGEFRRALPLLNGYIETQNLIRGKAFFYRAMIFHALDDDVQARKDMMQAMYLNKSEREMAIANHLIAD